MTDHWGEPCNRTGEVHPVDPFHNLKNHFASVAFSRNLEVYNIQNGAVIELLSTLLSYMLSIAVLTNEV